MTKENWDNSTKETTYEGEFYRVIFKLMDIWSDGYNATVRIENTGNDIIENWMLKFDFQGAVTSIWNAVMIEQNQEGYLVKNAVWNQDIEVGKSVEFGICGEGNFSGFPKEYELIGNLKDVPAEDYTITYQLKNDWESGFIGEICIENNTEDTLEDWILEFDFPRNINSIWNAVIESHEEEHYVIKNAGYNANIAGGQKITLGFMGEKGSDTDVPYNYFLRSYDTYTGDSMELDTDGDGIVDGLETQWGLNYKKADTDGDGLSDYEEIYLLRTNPLKIDTDDNGVIDADEDLDGDGLTNKEELILGTDPANSDCDGDGLTDYQEIVVYHCDPLNYDTDGDGLSDYDDVVLGFSPLLQDTDENGILDPDEKVGQTVEEVFDDETGRGITKVSVSMSLSGNIEKKVGVVNVYDFDQLSKNVVGLIGIPVEINSDVEFDTATIQFVYDEKALGDTQEDNLAVLWYDEKNDWYHVLDRESVIDTQNNTVSIETTHFSTYMLVDTQKWFEAWRENIDYRVSQEGDEIHYFDIAFVVDTSGSMYGTRMSNAQSALTHFVDSMQGLDEAALISFNSIASVVKDFTMDMNSIKAGINSLRAGGGTDVNAGLIKALNTYKGREGNKEKIIVLICDGDVNYYQSTINKCIENNIRIYAVNVQNVAAHKQLQKMAEQTGGQYYYGADSNELTYLLGEIQNNTTNKIDTTDADQDGLYDVYETAGIKLSNGTVIYTDPTQKDTDGDGLTDYEETGLIYNIDDRYIGDGMVKEVKYFRLHSDPTKQDTDGDGILDNEDPHPWFAEAIWIELSNKFEGRQYLTIVSDEGVVTDAGNQDWWSEKTESKTLNFKDYMTDINHRLWHMGCGVIAMTDAEIYLAQQNEGYCFTYPYWTEDYNSTTNKPFYDNTTGTIARTDYMGYAEYNSRYKYCLTAALQYATGVYPMDMEEGMTVFLEHNNNPNTFVRWAPYTLEGKNSEKEDVAEKMEKMLANNLPVVFSYYTSNEDKELPLYTELEDAQKGVNMEPPVASHYMTCIGLYKTIQKDGTGYDYIMKVVSWGKIYYIRYDEYSNNLSCFSNILAIGKRFA